jgi:hypothetical protein
MAIISGKQSLYRLLLSLLPVDCLRLAPVFIYRKDKASVKKLFIKLDGRRCQKDHYRTFHTVLMCYKLSGSRILARACDGKNAFALQKLQGIRGASRLPLPRSPVPCASDPSRPCKRATALSLPSTAPYLLPARIRG